MLREFIYLFINLEYFHFLLCAVRNLHVYAQLLLIKTLKTKRVELQNSNRG